MGGFELLKMKNVKVGMVQRGEVDIGGGMFSLMKERAVNFKCSLTKISKNMFTFCFFSGGGGLQQRHQCWREYNLDENSKVIFILYCQKNLYRRQVSRKIFCFLLHWETPVSPSPSSGGLPSRRQSGSPSGLPPSPWPPSCSSLSPRFDSFSSLYFFNGRPFLAGGDKDPPGPSFKGDGTPPNCMVYIWSSCKAGWILHLPF